MFKHRVKLFTSLFAPCVPSVNPWFTLSVTPSSVFIPFCCHLLLCVAIVSLIIPLCCHPLSSSPSLRTVQSTGVFVPSIHFVDPHACLVAFHIAFFHAPSFKSCCYILPRVPPLKQVIFSTDVDVWRLYNRKIWCFLKSILFQFV